MVGKAPPHVTGFGNKVTPMEKTWGAEKGLRFRSRRTGLWRRGGYRDGRGLAEGGEHSLEEGPGFQASVAGLLLLAEGQLGFTNKPEKSSEAGPGRRPGFKDQESTP